MQNLLSLNFFKCVWIEEKDISNVETLLKVCNNLQLDGEKILEDSKGFINFYNSLADKATKHNVFGSPSYVLNNEVFWGQDRLDLLEEKILENF